MDKNTLIAILLSTVVVIASFVIQPKLFPNAYSSQNDETNVEVENNQNEEIIAEEKVISPIINNNSDEIVTEEKQITINTGKAEIILTNKGGDIISYQLDAEKNKDTDAGVGVQMVDNVTENNRACSVAFGLSDAPIINDYFKTEKVDDYTVLFTKRFTVKNSDETESSFIFGKRYTFMPDEYVFKLEILVHGEDENTKVNLNNAFYSLRTSPQIGPHFNAKLNRYENRQFISYNGKKAKRQIISSKQFKQYSKEYIWNGIGGKYFTELVYPLNINEMDYSWYSTLIEKDDYANAQAILVRKPIEKQDVNDTYYMYFGPRNEKDLKVYNVAENNKWNLEGIKFTECLQSSGWLGWLETLLKWFMEILNKFIGNWGISIIVMTIIIKLLMFPFTRNQSLSSLKMQEIQPKIQVIQNKYKENPQKQQEEMAKIYKEAGYNPMSGCLPMLVQFLILFAMYNLFNNYFEFRGASFIPGWISDLSSGDSIHTFTKSIPFFGNQLRILPVIYLASQLFYGKITGNMGASAPGQSQASMKFMMYGMPIMFFFLFYNAPSGLLLYWTVSNIFQMGQQLIINKMVKSKKAEIEAKKNKKNK